MIQIPLFIVGMGVALFASSCNSDRKKPQEMEGKDKVPPPVKDSKNDGPKEAPPCDESAAKTFLAQFGQSPQISHSLLTTYPQCFSSILSPAARHILTGILESTSQTDLGLGGYALKHSLGVQELQALEKLQEISGKTQDGFEKIFLSTVDLAIQEGVLLDLPEMLKKYSEKASEKFKNDGVFCRAPELGPNRILIKSSLDRRDFALQVMATVATHRFIKNLAKLPETSLARIPRDKNHFSKIHQQISEGDLPVFYYENTPPGARGEGVLARFSRQNDQLFIFPLSNIFKKEGRSSRASEDQSLGIIFHELIHAIQNQDKTFMTLSSGEAEAYFFEELFNVLDLDPAQLEEVPLIDGKLMIPEISDMKKMLGFSVKEVFSGSDLQYSRVAREEALKVKQAAKEPPRLSAITHAFDLSTIGVWNVLPFILRPSPNDESSSFRQGVFGCEFKNDEIVPTAEELTLPDDFDKWEKILRSSVAALSEYEKRSTNLPPEQLARGLDDVVLFYREKVPFMTLNAVRYLKERHKLDPNFNGKKFFRDVLLELIKLPNRRLYTI